MSPGRRNGLQGVKNADPQSTITLEIAARMLNRSQKRAPNFQHRKYQDLIRGSLNECAEKFRAKLIEKVQAFVLRFDARLVMADQGHIELATEIRSDAISVGLPVGSEKVQIFAYYE